MGCHLWGRTESDTTAVVFLMAQLAPVLTSFLGYNQSTVVVALLPRGFRVWICVIGT